MPHGPLVGFTIFVALYESSALGGKKQRGKKVQLSKASFFLCHHWDQQVLPTLISHIYRGMINGNSRGNNVVLKNRISTG